MAAEPKTEYIVVTNNVTASNNRGKVDICTRIDSDNASGITDEELLKIKDLQRKFAQEVEDLLI